MREGLYDVEAALRRQGGVYAPKWWRKAASTYMPRGRSGRAARRSQAVNPQGFR